MQAYLAGSIDNLGRVVLRLVADHFAEGVFDGGVVALDEVAVDELDGERRLACMESSQLGEIACGCSLRCWRRTDRPTTDNGNLALLWRRRHLLDLRSEIDPIAYG